MEIVRNEGSAARDHLANERTFLAWLRTALGLVGLGLLLERFELDGEVSGRVAGVALIVFGCLSLSYALVRYLRIARHLSLGTFPVARVGPLLFGAGALILVAASLLFGCGAGEAGAPVVAASPAPVSQTPRADGEPCQAATDCASGLCEGQGCDAAMPGTCASVARACTRDLAAYCGCDGVTFRGSGSCPNARYAHRGPCEGAADPETR